MPSLRARPLAERLAAATSSGSDLGSLAQAVFAAVAADVPFDFACLAVTDPTSGLIARAFKSRALPVGDEEFAATEYGEPDVNRFEEIAGRPRPVGVLSVDTGGRPEDCRRFREFMAPRFGFTDELRVACHAGGTTWGLLALYRGPGEPPFTRQDGDLLGGVHQIVADGVRRALFTGEVAGASGGAAVLILDAEDRVTDTTAVASQRIEDLGGWDGGFLPTCVAAVAAQARASGQPARTRVRGTTGGWLALQAMTLDGPGTGRSVVVTVDAATPAAIGELALAARGLTAREQDVARLVLQGASTRAIADSLFLSPHTVQDHLKAIFRKLGVGSRREMIAQLVLP